nr:reverse transcriptase domain-containing protein [Tanacetum cinerariifolium]
MATNENDDDVPPAGGGDLPAPDLRTMEELCQLNLNGRGALIAPVAIQATNFGLKNDMIQQVQNSYQCHRLSGDEANKHLDKFLKSPKASKHHDTINASVGETFMKRRLEECYDLFKNITAHHNVRILSLKGGNNQGRNQFFQGAIHGQNPPPAYQAPTYQALGYQALIQQALIPQSQVMTTTEFTNNMKANDAILKNMQTDMTLFTNYNLELKNMFGQFMKMNTASSSGSRTLTSNTITNSKEDLQGITT